MEEEDTCRICRSGPEEDQPLFHPCKCSGSIGKVHQDCLIDWLQHSKKKSCELCNTELRFHKVYSPTMPKKLPYYLYVRRLLVQSVYGIRFAIRAVFVAASWLAVLPLMNLGIWRLHFMIVDVIIWSLLGGPAPSHRLIEVSTNATSSINTTDIVSNATSALTASPPSSPIAEIITSNSTITNTTMLNSIATFSFGNRFPLLIVDKVTIRFLSSAELKKAFDKLGHDVFEGQILTCAIVVCFVAIFLLREWCLQNMPQAVEGMAFAGEPVVPPVPAPAPVLVPIPQEVRDEVVAMDAQATVEEDFKDELEDLSKRLASSTESIGQDILADATSRRRRDTHLEGGSQLSRPRLTSDVVPDPPELQGSSRGMQQIAEEHQSEEVEESTLTIDELRRLRAEKYGKAADVPLANGTEAKEEESDIWLDVEESSFVELDKGKGRAKEEHIDETPESVTQDSTPKIDDAFKDPSTEKAKDGEDTSEEKQIESSTESHAVETVAAVEIPPEVEVFGAANNAPAVQEGAGAAAAQGGGVIDADDWEAEGDNADRAGEDDLDGIMEAIGMRGPLYNLLTNMLMMFVLCSFVLMLAVALPYFIGRLIGVGSNFIRLVRLPVQGLRFLTDPAVDLIIAQGGKGLRKSLSFAGVKLPTLESKSASSYSSITSGANLSFIKNSIVSMLTSGDGTAKTVSIISDQTPSWKEAIATSVSSLLPNLQLILSETSSHLQDFYYRAEVKTQGVTQRDKIFCILLGQLYWLLSLFIQQRLAKVYTRMNLKWLRTSVEQQLVVLKVLAFICLELIIFPWCCGMLFDMALFPLWEDVSFASRWALLQRRPLSIAFTQWALGTLYMFSLAMFASTTRGVVRSGVLCFVRDAGDPTFHPIKDILERKSLEQLRKIGLSGAIYAGIMLATFGSCTLALRATNEYTQILPLRWEMHQALTTSGLELLFIAFIMPPLVKSWLPVYVLRRAFKNWWRITARQLRISSFLMGGRFPAEEGRHVRNTYKAKIMRKTAPIAGEDQNTSVTFIKDGGFARVPADDHAIMSTPIVIHCDETGRPLTERGKEALRKQTEAIAKMTKKPQYTIVYLPPNFKRRIISLIGLLWATICICFLTVLLAPLLFGRYLTSRLIPITERPLHDGYSWMLGSLIIGAVAQIYKNTRRIARSGNRKRRCIRLIRRTAEYAWMFISISILSCLLGILIEQYLNGMCQLLFLWDKPKMYDISLLHAWSIGMLVHHIIAQVYEMYPTAVIDWDKPVFNRNAAFFMLFEIRGVQHRRPKVWHLTKKAFIPAALYYTLAIITPMAILVSLKHSIFEPKNHLEVNIQSYLVYCFCSMILTTPTSGLSNIAARWTILIRDEHFLISTQLKNHPTHQSSKNGNGSAAREGSTPEIHEANGNGDLGTDAPQVAEGPLPDVILNQ